MKVLTAEQGVSGAQELNLDPGSFGQGDCFLLLCPWIVSNGLQTSLINLHYTVTFGWQALPANKLTVVLMNTYLSQNTKH